MAQYQQLAAVTQTLIARERNRHMELNRLPAGQQNRPWRNADTAAKGQRYNELPEHSSMSPLIIFELKFTMRMASSLRTQFCTVSGMVLPAGYPTVGPLLSHVEYQRKNLLSQTPCPNHIYHLHSPGSH